ncbi:MAG TPA: GNAT family N-acetyltransferase [Roseiarcus sp.]|nr:GNAT family N-acetyltransferase [Roseiarcus sp.]
MSARSGARVAMIGCIGRDNFGARLRANLDAAGVDSTAVAEDEKAASGMNAAIVPRRRRIWRRHRVDDRLTPAAEGRRRDKLAGQSSLNAIDRVAIRLAESSVVPDLRLAVVELQEHERRLHPTHLPGSEIADAYVAWMVTQAARSGAILIAEVDGVFAGFAAGWVDDDDKLAEAPDSRRFGLVSDICVLPAYRGRRLASRLLDGIENRLATTGVIRIRIGVLAANGPACASYERSGFTAYEIVYEKVVGQVA